MGSMAVAPTLMDEEQRSRYAEYAPEGIGFDDHAILGPILFLKVHGRSDDLSHLSRPLGR
jgi:hypothetical protein